MMRLVVLTMLLSACEPRGAQLMDMSEGADILTVPGRITPINRSGWNLDFSTVKDGAATVIYDLASSPLDLAPPPDLAPMCKPIAAACAASVECCDGADTNPPGSSTWQPACTSGHCCTTFAVYGAPCSGAHFRVCSDCGIYGGEACGGCT